MSLAAAIDKLLAHVHDHEQFPPGGKWQKRFESLDIAVWKKAHRLGLDTMLPKRRKFLPVSSFFLGKTNLPVCRLPTRVVIRTLDDGEIKRIEHRQEKCELQGLHYWRNRLRNLQARIENPGASSEKTRPDDEPLPILPEDRTEAYLTAIREIEEIKMSGRIPDDEFRDWKKEQLEWARTEGPKLFAQARLKKLDPQAIAFASLTPDEVGALPTTDIFPGLGEVALQLWWNLVTPVGQRIALDQARDWLEREPKYPVPEGQWKQLMKVQERNDARRREWERELFGKTVGIERIKDYLCATRGITHDEFLDMDPHEAEQMLRMDAEKKANARPTDAEPRRSQKRKAGAPRRNKARNTWIAQQRKKGKTLETILTELQEKCAKKGWEPVSSPQAIHAILQTQGTTNFKSNRGPI